MVYIGMLPAFNCLSISLLPCPHPALQAAGGACDGGGAPAAVGRRKHPAADRLHVSWVACAWTCCCVTGHLRTLWDSRPAPSLTNPLPAPPPAAPLYSSSCRHWQRRGSCSRWWSGQRRRTQPRWRSGGGSSRADLSAAVSPPSLCGLHLHGTCLQLCCAPVNS